MSRIFASALFRSFDLRNRSPSRGRPFHLYAVEEREVRAKRRSKTRHACGANTASSTPQPLHSSLNAASSSPLLGVHGRWRVGTSGAGNPERHANAGGGNPSERARRTNSNAHQLPTLCPTTIQGTTRSIESEAVSSVASSFEEKGSCVLGAKRRRATTGMRRARAARARAEPTGGSFARAARPGSCTASSSASFERHHDTKGDGTVRKTPSTRARSLVKTSSAFPALGQHKRAPDVLKFFVFSFRRWRARTPEPPSERHFVRFGECLCLCVVVTRLV